MGCIYKGVCASLVAIFLLVWWHTVVFHLVVYFALSRFALVWVCRLYWTASTRLSWSRFERNALMSIYGDIDAANRRVCTRRALALLPFVSLFGSEFSQPSHCEWMADVSERQTRQSLCLSKNANSELIVRDKLDWTYFLKADLIFTI
jgi:hypothetical protein